jgi:hypothetical protein
MILDDTYTSYIFSAGNNISKHRYGIDVLSSKVNYGTAQIQMPELSANTICDIVYGNNEVTVNNTTRSIGSTVTDFEATKPLYICGENGMGSYKPKIRLYSFSLEDANGVKKLDMIPVRIGNGGYLYDKVSGELFCNNATNDTFAIGNDVQS